MLRAGLLETRSRLQGGAQGSNVEIMISHAVLCAFSPNQIDPSKFHLVPLSLFTDCEREVRPERGVSRKCSLPK